MSAPNLYLDGKPIIILFLNDGHIKPDREGTYLCHTTLENAGGSKAMRFVKFAGGYWCDDYAGAGILQWCEIPEMPGDVR